MTNNCIVEVSPAVGCIPSGGMMELLINVHPVNVGSFDIKICINIKESRSLYVRITGIAEEPRISVEKVCVIAKIIHTMFAIVMLNKLM